MSSLVILCDEPSLLTRRLCGVRFLARLLREAYMAGVRSVTVVGKGVSELRGVFGDGRELGIEIRYSKTLAVEDSHDPDPVVLLLPGAFLDRGAIRILSSMTPDVIAVSDDGEPVAVVTSHERAVRILREGTSLDRLLSVLDRARVVRLSELRVYYPDLRRQLPPLGVRVRSEGDLKRVKAMLVARTTKGLHVLSELNKYAENALTKAIADVRWITPNRITLLVNVLAYVASALMFLGHALAAVLLMFVVAILDGVDGKLARLRGVTSYLGKLEHSLDMLFEQVFYVAWIWHVFTVSRNMEVLMLGLAFLVSDSFSRHVYMQFKLATGRNLLLMSRVDRVIALFDGRRNVWLIYMLIGVLLHAECLALMGMLVHSLLTSATYLARAFTHLRRLDRSGETGAWHAFLMR